MSSLPLNKHAHLGTWHKQEGMQANTYKRAPTKYLMQACDLVMHYIMDERRLDVDDLW